MVKNVKIDSARPMMAKIFINVPNTSKHLMQIFGTKISASATITARISNGNRSISTARGGSLHTRPATKQPMGTAAMPQRKPKNISLR